MNSILRTISFLLVFLTASSQSALISSNGYTLNSDTSIVTDGELDWLQWDENLGISREEVESTLVDNAQYQGWRYATYDEMLSLIKTFFPFVNINSGNWNQSTRYGLVTADYVDYGLFHELITTELDNFGRLFGSLNRQSTFSSISAFYGEVSFDNDSGGILVNESQRVLIFDGLIDEPSWEDRVGFGTYEYEGRWSTLGHALVRESVSVNTPSSLPLLLIGLIIVFRRLHQREHVHGKGIYRRLL